MRRVLFRLVNHFVDIFKSMLAHASLVASIGLYRVELLIPTCNFDGGFTRGPLKVGLE